MASREVNRDVVDPASNVVVTHPAGGAHIHAWIAAVVLVGAIDVLCRAAAVWARLDDLKANCVSSRL